MTNKRQQARPRSDHHLGFFRLLEFMRQADCPVCHAVEARLRREMEHFLYESVNDPELRREMREDDGLCRAHSDLLLEQAEALAGSILAGDWLAAAMERWKRPHKISAKVRGSGRSCHFCRIAAEAEEGTTAELADHLADAQLQACWSGPVMLCIGHLRRLAEATHRSDAFAEVLTLHLEQKYQRLLDQMALTRDKHDYHRTSELLGEEKNAWIKALAVLIGK